MKGTTLKTLRVWHRYLGLFFAPLIVLFAISGALQTFRLQEEQGYVGKPPYWIVWLASVHKDQALPRSESVLQTRAIPARPASKTPQRHSKSRRSFALQLFVVAMAFALALSSVLGAAIALGTRNTRVGALVALLLGAAVPVALLLAL